MPHAGRPLARLTLAALTLALSLPFAWSAGARGIAPPDPAMPGVLPPGPVTFATGDLFVSLRTGEVMWWSPTGVLRGVLANIVPGKAEGMGFDASGLLYVSHYCADASACLAGNGVERFASDGHSLGPFGGGYDCNPYSFAFDRQGRIYVGEADCTGDLLQLDATGALVRRYDVAPDPRGAARIDLAGDGCTLFYTTQGPHLKRFDLCAAAQLPDFDAAPLPDGYGGAVRLLPDGGALVATGGSIARLDAAGVLVRTYDVAGSPDLWIGLDLAGDGTFWASNYGSSDLCRFDLASGAVLRCFNTGTPTTTVKDVLIRH
jgi:sugar lactone lactonase YvrE